MSCLALFASGRELTLRAEVSAQVSGDFSYYSDGVNYRGGRVGRIALDLPLASYRNFQLTGHCAHYSLLNTSHDRGEERCGLGLQWRPFGGVR